MSILLGTCLVLTGCSADQSGVGLTHALNACTAVSSTTEDPSGETIDNASSEELARNAVDASTRADLAQRAATVDARWGSLAEAMGILADAANAILAADTAGQPALSALTSDQWDNVKAASNISILECEAARIQSAAA